jgi:hypothetical protein
VVKIVKMPSYDHDQRRCSFAKRRKQGSQVDAAVNGIAQ